MIDREEFRLWLVAHDSNEVVGDTHCPAVCYLRDALGKVAPFVTYKNYGWPGATFVTPPWLSTFARTVDNTVDSKVGTLWDEITAKQALTIVDEVPA